MSEQPLSDEVPEADAVEQSRAVDTPLADEDRSPGLVDDRPAAPEVDVPDDAEPADALEQAREVPLDDEAHEH